MNNLIITGNTTKDITIQETSTGKKYARFSLAVKRRGAEHTDFINCIVWDRLAEITAQYLTKGKKALVRGELRVESYQDNSGNTRTNTTVYANDIEFLSPANSTNTESYQKEEKRQNITKIENLQEVKNDDSDIPF